MGNWAIVQIKNACRIVHRLRVAIQFVTLEPTVAAAVSVAQLIVFARFLALGLSFFFLNTQSIAALKSVEKARFSGLKKRITVSEPYDTVGFRLGKRHIVFFGIRNSRKAVDVRWYSMDLKLKSRLRINEAFSIENDPEITLGDGDSLFFQNRKERIEPRKFPLVFNTQWRSYDMQGKPIRVGESEGLLRIFEVENRLFAFTNFINASSNSTFKYLLAESEGRFNEIDMRPKLYHLGLDSLTATQIFCFHRADCFFFGDYTLTNNAPNAQVGLSTMIYNLNIQAKQISTVVNLRDLIKVRRFDIPVTIVYKDSMSIFSAFADADKRVLYYQIFNQLTAKTSTQRRAKLKKFLLGYYDIVNNTTFTRALPDFKYIYFGANQKGIYRYSRINSTTFEVSIVDPKSLLRRGRE